MTQIKSTTSMTFMAQSLQLYILQCNIYVYVHTYMKIIVYACRGRRSWGGGWGGVEGREQFPSFLGFLE